MKALLQAKCRRWLRLVSPIITVGVIGVGATLLVWQRTVSAENQALVEQLANRADNQAVILAGGMGDYRDKLYAVRAFFNASSEVTREEFETFANALLTDQPAILNISWLPRVTKEGRAAHEIEAAHDGLTDYHIRAIGPDGSLPVAPERDEYFPKFYSTEARDSPVYGLDLNDGGMRQRTLEHVRDSETLSISPPLLLHIGNGDRRGFWAGLPVYAQGLPHATAEDRRRNLLGIVQGVFQIGVMVDTILAGVKLPLRIHLFAPGAATDDAPVYSGSRFGVGSIKPKSQAELAAVLHRTLPLDFGDKRWTLVVEPEPLAAPAGNPPSSIILVCGLLLSGGLTSFMWATQRYAGNLELANAHAARQNLRFDAALNNMGQGLLMYDPEGRLIVSNRRVAELLGMRWEEWESAALGATVPRTMQIIHDLTNVTVRNRPQLIGELRDILSRQGTGSIVFERTDGRAFCATCTSMADGGFVVTLEDVTEQRLSEQKIKYLAHYDPLTDLPNRALFHERLAEFLPQARHKPFAVFILDLDRFKNVNDTLGHPSGDKVLSAVAERMRGCTRGTDLVARLGGDEFAVVTFNPPADTALLATRLIDAVKAPYRLDGRQVVVGTSIGIAVAPSDGTDADQLMKNADLALYSSKADGGCSYRFFDPRLNPIGKRVKPPDPPPLHRAPETRPA